MITSVQQRPEPSAVLIVYGRDISGIPRASWFNAGDQAAAIAASQPMKLDTLELKTDEEKALTIGVHEGVLKGSGRMIIGSASGSARCVANTIAVSAVASDNDDLRLVTHPGFGG